MARTTAKFGAAAVKTLRLPSSYEIQAMRSAFFAETSSSGSPGLRIDAMLTGSLRVGTTLGKQRRRHDQRHHHRNNRKTTHNCAGGCLS